MLPVSSSGEDPEVAKGGGRTLLADGKQLSTQVMNIKEQHF
ncbi:hypothetical protein SLEP1_g26674 [Rubroshorea leprosula]|uniref:Uncharacterized protein n=1 Tax=Rubroshorea leprosula TaxID=152421 RepID=A0AAV5JMV4_9ROSI|nr:hypothetical protein SLEP1_g26674 [Rubroshorea leprosula]